MDSMRGFLKLKGKPVQIDLFTKYRAKEPINLANPELEPDPDSKVRPWMHVLTVDQMTEIEAVGVEAFRSFAAKGANVSDSDWRSQRVENLSLLLYSLKVGPEPDAKPLFESAEELATLPYMEAVRLNQLFYSTFRPTADEIKNSLRERLGGGFKTASSSPKTTKTRAQSSQKV